MEEETIFTLKQRSAEEEIQYLRASLSAALSENERLRRAIAEFATRTAGYHFLRNHITPFPLRIV